MLELLTGRKPFDRCIPCMQTLIFMAIHQNMNLTYSDQCFSSKPRSEQHLVQWALPQLHDLDALENMADPALRGLYPPKSLSRFANATALCIQVRLL